MESNVKEFADTASKDSNCMVVYFERTTDLLLVMRCWTVLFSNNCTPVCPREQFFFSPRGVLQKGNAGTASLPGRAHDTMIPSVFRGNLAHFLRINQEAR